MADAVGIDLSSCPYYRGVGKCESGCYSEPSCFTDRPLGGWPSEADVLRQDAGVDECRQMGAAKDAPRG